MSSRKSAHPKTAQHRPAVKKRRNRHDAYIAGDLFSGFGGLTQGLERGGFDVIVAANHNEYKVEVHEANHPTVEHWIADLVDRESADYHDVRQLPPVDVLTAGVSCVNHSQANTQKAYAQGLSLFDLDDPEFEERVTRSERDRATANCVLHYAAVHHPLMMLIECTTELQSWGPALPGKTKVGDGTTYRWWLGEFGKLGYKHKALFLNSRFFDVDQSRDRLYVVFWDAKLPAPDLDHRPPSWCANCDRVVEAVWTWKTGIPASGSVRYGKQYDYRCPSCRREVIPPSGYALRSLDLRDLGTKIGDRPMRQHKVKGHDMKVWSPLAPATMARAERCRQRFAEFPAVVMPTKAIRGSERHPWQPMTTQTGQQEDAILSTGALVAMAGNTYEHPGSSCRSRALDEPIPAQTGTQAQGVLTPSIALAVDNYQGAPRGADDAIATQGGSETMAIVSSGVLPLRTHGTSRSVDEPMQTIVAGAGSGGLSVLSAGVLPYRKNTTPTSHGEAMPTVTSDQIPALMTAAGRIQNNGDINEAKYRTYPLDDPFGTVTGSAVQQGLLFSGWTKSNGSTGAETAAHPVTDPWGTLTSRDTTTLVNAEWRAALAELPLEECYLRMMNEQEIGRACGFDVDFADTKGSFVVWGSPRAQVDGFGNAVSPPVGEWITLRMHAALHGQVIA